MGGLVLGLASMSYGVVVGPNINVSKTLNSQAEQAITINRADPQNIFIGTNDLTPGGNPPQMRFARSTDGGQTFTTGTIATGSDGLVAACCDPSVTSDSFGNLYMTYIDDFLGIGGNPRVIVGRSADGGATWSQIANLGNGDQPTITAGPHSVNGEQSIWVTWARGGLVRAANAVSTGLGVTGAFSGVLTLPGSNSGSFGDIAIGANGKVADAWINSGSGEGPDAVRVQVDLDGTGANNFGAAVVATSTNVGAFDFLAAQPNRSVDSESGLAWDHQTNRLYLVYTDESVDESDNFDVLLRHSDDDGQTWSAAVMVNDDGTTRSQFLPRLAIDQTTGNLAMIWYDARNDDGSGVGDQRSAGANNEAELWGTFVTDGGATILPNFKISDSMSSALVNGDTFDFGDYVGLDFFDGVAHAVWADNSNSTGDNPSAIPTFDAYTARFAIPEPGTMLLLAGMGGVAARRRRR
jgi:hypothetical protein